MAVTAGATSEGIDARLLSSARISGRVIDAHTGEPLASVCMNLTEIGGGPGFGFAATGEDGSYSVDENLQPG